MFLTLTPIKSLSLPLCNDITNYFINIKFLFIKHQSNLLRNFLTNRKIYYSFKNQYKNIPSYKSKQYVSTFKQINHHQNPYNVCSGCLHKLTSPSKLNILITQYSMLNTQYLILNTQYSMLNTQYLIPNTLYSILNTQCSI